MSIKILLNTVFFLVMVCSTVYAHSNFILRKINCNGEIIESTLEKQDIIKEKGFIGDVQRGFLFKNEFFAVDHDYELIVTTFVPAQTLKCKNFNRIWDKSFRLWKVIFVDDRRIIVSARKNHRNSTVETRNGCNFFQFDRLKNLFNEIPVTGCSNDYVSIFQDTIYFTNQDGNICAFNNGKEKSLGIKGTSPSISPDGTNLAYISFGIAFENISLYDLKTNKAKSVFKSLGPKSINPIIRWSCDSLSIAFRKQSDIASASLFIFDVLNSKIVHEFEKSPACNWFLGN